MLRLKRPTTPEELLHTIGEARQAGIQVQIIGSNSTPRGQFSREKLIQPISLLRVNKFIEFAAENRTVTVEAGLTLDALQQHLAWHNQWIAVDPPGLAVRPGGTRTLGGLIATNARGALCERHGDWGTMILGMRWINGAGQWVHEESAVGQPNPMIGSAGGWGCVTEITLRTEMRPADEQALVIFCSASRQVDDMHAAIHATGIQTSYAQTMGGKIFAANPLQLPAARAMVVVGFLDEPEVCAAHIARLRALPELRNIETISQSAVPAARLRSWMTTASALTPPVIDPANAARMHQLKTTHDPRALFGTF